MKKLLLLILLPLAACSYLKTPEDKYYALNGAVIATVKVTKEYVKECKQQPQEHDCYDNLPKINSAAKALDTAIQQADKVFVTKDSQYYDLALSVSENALMNLQTLLKE